MCALIFLGSTLTDKPTHVAVADRLSFEGVRRRTQVNEIGLGNDRPVIDFEQWRGRRRGSTVEKNEKEQ